MSVPFIDLSRTTPEREQALHEAVTRVLQHKQFILGKEVQAFEETVAARMPGAHVIGVSSGTDALLVALMALGVGPGDRVLTTPFSFFATAGVISRLGARPVFCDIDPVNYGICNEALKRFDPREFAAVVPVHLFGHTLDLDPIRAWSAGSVPILEDAAQAIGGRDAQGRVAGTVGDLAAFSFFPTKNLGAMGDAGMVTTMDAERGDLVRRLRVHGQAAQYRHVEVGGNFRLDAIQAAGLTVGLGYLDEDIANRRANACAYHAALEDLADRGLERPVLDDHHTVHQYVVRIREGRRDEVQGALRERGIGAMVYYPIPFHLQPCFADLGYGAGDFPEAERAAEEVLALPAYPGLREDELAEVCTALHEIL